MLSLSYTRHIKRYTPDACERVRNFAFSGREMSRRRCHCFTQTRRGCASADCVFIISHARIFLLAAFYHISLLFFGLAAKRLALESAFVLRARVRLCAWWWKHQKARLIDITLYFMVFLCWRTERKKRGVKFKTPQFEYYICFLLSKNAKHKSLFFAAVLRNLDILVVCAWCVGWPSNLQDTKTLLMAIAWQSGQHTNVCPTFNH